jgi:S1-C subfamily serine protease
MKNDTGNAVDERSRRPEALWLPSNRVEFDENASGWRQVQAGADLQRPSTHAADRPAFAATDFAVRAARPAPSPTPVGSTTNRRLAGGLLAAVVIAGTVGGATGSALTAGALRGGYLAPPPAAASPAAISRSPSQTVSQPLPENGLKAVYKQVSPAVVSIQTAQAARRGSPSTTPPSSPGGPGVTPPNSQDLPLLPRGQGTGFIVDEAGHILTNNHVIDGATRVTIRLQDGTRVQAQVVGTDPASDLALLKAELPKGHAGIAVLGDSDVVEPGDTAIAIGSPFGLDHTITAGIISAVSRDYGSASGRPMRGLIQTDAPINPGNSGGPLLNALGEVIGITTAIESPVRGSVGVGFAIPINAAKRLLPRLQTGQSIQHAWLGISGTALTEEIAREIGLPAGTTQGVVVAQVVPDGPAAKAGLRGGSGGENATGVPRGGDIILAVDGRAVRRVQDISDHLDTKSPGESITLTILREGAKQEMKVTLAAWPSNLR